MGVSWSVRWIHNTVVQTPPLGHKQWFIQRSKSTTKELLRPNQVIFVERWPLNIGIWSLKTSFLCIAGQSWEGRSDV